MVHGTTSIKSMKMTSKILFLILGCVYINAALADIDTMTEFELMQQNLLKNQAAEDVSQLIYTLDRTQKIARVTEQQLRAHGVDQFAMIRFGEAKFDPEVWLLYRLSDKNYIENFSVDDGRLRFHYAGVAIPSEWDSVFHEFLIGQQKKPSPPLQEDRRMVGGHFWDRGYTGIVDIYSGGELRTYLLATEDVKTLYQQSAYDKFLCTTFFSGLHCKNGDYTMAGWVRKELQTLMKNSQQSSQRIINK
jgi:hypothetical protein